MLALTCTKVQHPCPRRDVGVGAGGEGGGEGGGGEEEHGGEKNIKKANRETNSLFCDEEGVLFGHYFRKYIPSKFYLIQQLFPFNLNDLRYRVWSYPDYLEHIPYRRF